MKERQRGKREKTEREREITYLDSASRTCVVLILPSLTVTYSLLFERETERETEREDRKRE